MKNEINDKLAGMLGLAARARMLASGQELACDCTRRGKAVLLLIAHDASANTKKRVFNCAKYYETACFEIPIDQNDIGHCIGRSGAIAALALTDRNMANGIIKLIDKTNAQMSKADGNPREV